MNNNQKTILGISFVILIILLFSFVGGQFSVISDTSNSDACDPVIINGDYHIQTMEELENEMITQGVDSELVDEKLSYYEQQPTGVYTCQ